MYSQILKMSSTISWPNRVQMRQILADNGLYNGVMLPGYDPTVMAAFVDNMDLYYEFQASSEGYEGQLSFQDTGTSWNVSLWMLEDNFLEFGIMLRQQPFYFDLITERDILLAASNVALASVFSEALTVSSSLAEVEAAFGAA